MIRPLLVIDGDSFAHRAYHALPKSIRRKGNKGAGAIVGFANFLLRLYESAHPIEDFLAPPRVQALARPVEAPDRQERRDDEQREADPHALRAPGVMP
jgi:DNA polymerase-1